MVAHATVAAAAGLGVMGLHRNAVHLKSGGFVLPVGLVNVDKGASVGGRQVYLGAQVTESIKNSTASGDRIGWKAMGEKEVNRQGKVARGRRRASSRPPGCRPDAQAVPHDQQQETDRFIFCPKRVTLTVWALK
ncbi:hypothetical protein OHB00_39740 [Streptomyces sp. NBC_00631]|uniref:hypothetical protein n=1 Tax=Streptomyces sp. NBC_00631 TaxID=2975793 RepID=UPI0030E4D69B